MTFHSLSDSGMSGEDMRQEAWRIIEIFKDCKALGRLSRDERNFMDKMAQGFPVTTGQLFYMRELKTKYVE
jgi:hypothetical protein